METDLLLAERMLNKGGIDFISQIVSNEMNYKAALESFKPDLVITDYSMPAFDGMMALKILRTQTREIPFIIFTDSMNESIAVECMKAGTDDYILKDNLSRLLPEIKTSLEKYEHIRAKQIAEQSLLESERRFRNLFSKNLAVMLLIDPQSNKIIDANYAAENFYGWNCEELIQMKIDNSNTLSSEVIELKMQNTSKDDGARYELNIEGLMVQLEMLKF